MIGRVVVDVRARVRVVAPILAFGLVLGLTTAVTWVSVPSPVAKAAVPWLGSSAWAPSDTEVEQARKSYEAGRASFEEGSYEDAIAAFERAFELSGEANLLYNIALAYDRLGELEPALEYLERYRKVAPEAEQESLRRRSEGLQRRLAKQRESEAPAPAAPTKQQAAENERPSPKPGAADSSPSPTARHDKPPRIYGPASWGLTAVAAAGFGVGIGFGVASLGRTTDAEDGCTGGYCSEDVRADVEASRRNALVADIGIVVGSLAVAGIIAIVSVRAVRAKQHSASVQARRALPGFAFGFGRS